MATGANISITTPSAEDVPAESDPPTLSEDGNASKSTSIEATGQDPDVKTSYDGLTLESTLEPDTDDDDAGYAMFDIDVIHVLGVSMTQRPFALSRPTDLLPRRSRKRQYRFEFDVSDLLNDDVEFTKEHVERKARQLLRALADCRRFNDRPVQRVTIFFAYDISAVVLKKAISIASIEAEGHIETFTSIARIVFAGCFHRGGEQELGLKLLSFLNDASGEIDDGNEASWKPCISLSSVQSLVSMVRVTNAEFLASKISLRSRTFSLYTGTSPKRIHSTLRYDLATLGLSSELALQERDSEDIQAAFPGLMESIGAEMSNWAFLGPSQVALERSVMSLVPPEAPLLTIAPSPDHPVLNSDTYCNFRRLSGTQVMHIKGLDPQATTEAAEQISMDWNRRQQSSGQYSPRSFLFRFCAADSTRNSVTAMFTAFLLHSIRAMPSSVQIHQDQLQDQYKLQNSWTDDDLCKIALNSDDLMCRSSPLVLLGLDECDAASRKRFWTLLGTIARRSEWRIKIIVTISKPSLYSADNLREELKEWSKINILDWEVPELPKIDTDLKTRTHALLAQLRLCPPPFGNARATETIQRLESRNPNTLPSILSLVTMYSRWPAEKSRDNLSVFFDTIDLLDPSCTPREAAWAILRSVPDQELVKIVLTWMLGSQRPVTLLEFSGIVAFTRKVHDKHLGPPEAEEIERCSKELDGQIRGLAILEGDHFRIHPDVLELIADDSTEDWEALREQAPRLTAKVLLQYLRLDGIQERLHTLSKRYEDRIRQSGDAVTPPITSDGNDMLFYAVSALPHHLSGFEIPQDVEKQLRDSSGPYQAWSKFYWAMSNPFSRASLGTLKSAWSTWESTLESGPPDMLRLRGVNGQDQERCPPMESLAEAVRVDNEDLALIFAEEVISNSQHQPLTKEETLVFPPQILWRATWLDMDRLLDLLLRHSKQQDDNSATFSPSMLYLACRIGSSKSADVLLNHDADVRIRRNGLYTPLFTACANGNVQIIRSMLNKDPTLLTWPQPETPLYAASCWGCWEAVEMLLERGAHPSQPIRDPEPKGDDDPQRYDSLPITATSFRGLPTTTRILLEHDADPNSFGPGSMDTCLWLAAMRSGDLDTMKMLLEYGGDPNDAKLEPPLLSDIIKDTQIPKTTKLTMLNLLLDSDQPVELDRASENGTTPLMVAAKSGNKFAVQWLLDKGASINAVDSGNHTALYLAIVAEKWDVVHQLLGHREKPLLDLVCSHSMTQLQTAMGNIDELGNLLEAGSDPNFVNKWQQTLLDCAVADEKTAVVKMLLESGRDIDVHHRDSDGWSPIMVATGHAPNQEIARMLVESGASISETTAAGHSPLHLAAGKSKPDILEVLLGFREADDLARQSLTGQTPLLSIHRLTEEQSLQCMRLLVRAGADINSQDFDGETLLIRSAEEGLDGRAVHKWLLAHPKIDVHLRSKVDGTALHLACRYGDEGLVSMLLDKGADANSAHMCIRSTPLIAACMPERPVDNKDLQSRIQGAERIVRALVAKGADVSLMSGSTVFSALCAAALCAGVVMINFILDKAASIRKPDPSGRLPIHFAAANGIRNFEAVALAHGEDIMVPDNFGKNALHWASQVGNAETVKAILQRLSPKDKKRYVNSEDADGWTPLAWASRTTTHDNGPFWARSEPQNYEATIRHLVDNGGDVLARFRMGRGDEAEEFTPLKMAKRCEHEEAVIKLLTPIGETSSQFEHEPVYSRSTGFCDFCFVQCYGITFDCKTCDEGRYCLCKKCLPSASVEHSRSVTFEGDHTFYPGNQQEFVLRPAPSVDSQEHAISGEDAPQAESVVGGRADESTPDFEPIDFREDDIKQLDFPDLNDLGGLEDL